LDSWDAAGSWIAIAGASFPKVQLASPRLRLAAAGTVAYQRLVDDHRTAGESLYVTDSADEAIKPALTRNDWCNAGENRSFVF